MTRRLRLLGFAAAVSVLSACDGLKEALTAHVDVVARAGSQELSVTRLGELLGGAKVPVPVTKENAQILAELWLNYQRVGMAAAAGDSLADPTLVNEAAYGVVAGLRAQRFAQSMLEKMPVDSGSEASYASGANGVFAARHILIGAAGAPAATPAALDSAKKVAEALRPTVTAENFDRLARTRSTEPNAAQSGGNLGIFGKGMMVPEFERAVIALKPGEISPVIMTQFGAHIVQRLPWALAQQEYRARYAGIARQAAESTFMAGLEKGSKIDVDADAPAKARDVALDVGAHRDDGDVMATFGKGKLTAARFAQWLISFPPQQRVTAQIGTAPDSVIRRFVGEVAKREIMVQKADSAGVKLAPEEQQQLNGDFARMVGMIYESLGLTPKSLADSAKTPADRQRMAAARVDAYIAKILAGEAQPIPVPLPMVHALSKKYEGSLNRAGIDRAVEEAAKVRTKADSSRNAGMPGTAVPLPGMPGAGTPPAGGPPTGGAPAPAQKQP